MKSLFVVVLVVLCTVWGGGDKGKQQTGGDKTYQQLMADTAMLAVEDSIDFGKFLCDRIQPMPQGKKWKNPNLIKDLIDIYNYLEIYRRIETDLDYYKWTTEGAADFSEALGRVKADIIEGKEIRERFQEYVAEYIKTMKRGDEELVEVDEEEGDKYVAVSGPAFGDLEAAKESLRVAFTERYGHYMSEIGEGDVPDRESVTPARWFPPVYKEFTNAADDPTEEKIKELEESIAKEKDFDTRAAMVFAMLGTYSFDSIHIREAEKIMEEGRYSVLLDLVWRAYRTAYNLRYSGLSRDSYSPNLRYNHYRRLVAYTMLKYIDEHPQDKFALLKYLHHCDRNDILRCGSYSVGNDTGSERMSIFLNGDLL